ncbi:MAG: hypothetical protein IT332_09590 [Ardenticatenales bacterium]|nr:hypothetical protein [Ardenticatenales bacterium]
MLSTPGALAACEDAQVNPLSYLRRHVVGDWGDLGAVDKAANEDALTTGARLFSAYTLPTDDRLWIITEADRSVTTLLLPLEYSVVPDRIAGKREFREVANAEQSLDGMAQDVGEALEA